MIDRNHALPVKQQCRILQLARSTVYYQPAETSADELALMHRIDELHLKFPFAGARMLSRLLKREELTAGLRRVSTLMKRMNIHALYRKPNTSKRHVKHPVYPYLLRTLSVTRSNQV